MPETESYAKFIQDKAQRITEYGFAPKGDLPGFLFDFQKTLVDWSLRKGRSAIYADCGLGKTAIELVWSDYVVRHTNRAVLLLTPLAVTAQTIAEGEKFGIKASRAVPGQSFTPGIYVTNYQRLHHFDSSDFVGVVCDESSILKSFEGVTRAAVTEFMRTKPYRLLCTATAAPNDYIELGTSSEALGHLGFMDMLSRFFKNNRNNCATNPFGKDSATRMPQWRFRGHAEKPFWRWVCSWARAVRKPSDIGGDDRPFVLPELVERVHRVRAVKPRDGMLFSVPAVGLQEEREERRRTLTERCEMAAQLVDTGRPAVCWAHLNDEADLLEKLIPDAIQVSGRDDDDEKEAKFEAFTKGQTRVLVIKPVIGAHGLNWQHCAHMTTFGGHSFEQHYQAVRRFWRFGQKSTVVADNVVSDGECAVLENLQRKMRQADHLFAELVAHMRDEMALSRTPVNYDKKESVPSWL
jgi:hypothetical protein